MKRLLALLSIVLFAISCEKGPEQQPGDQIIALNEVVESSIIEDDVDSFLVNLSLKGEGYTLSLELKNNAAELPICELAANSGSGEIGNCKLTLNDGKADKEVTNGKVNIVKENDVYTININVIVGVSAKYSFVYEGTITFNTEIEAYKNITLTEVVKSVATPYEDGSFNLDLSLKGDGYTASISLDNSSAVLPDGTYGLTSELGEVGKCVLTLNDGKKDHIVTYGSVKVVGENGIYTINIDAVVSIKEKYSLKYEGKVAFDIDFVPSPYTLIAQESNITKWEQGNYGYSEVVISGISKYTILVIDDSDNTIASLELVGEPGKSLSELIGEYTVGSENTVGTLFKGANSWGSVSGSYFYDEQNTQALISKGSVVITSMKDNNGKVYYSFTGKEVTSKNTSLNLMYVQVDEYQGTVIRNSVISSKKMNKSMKYSMYLPAGYEEGVSYPILYLLHGYGDENNAWLDKGRLFLTAREYEKNGGTPMIVVCPDGLTDFYQGRWENYMYEELMPEVESKYKFNGKRAVAGLSMGGYGSLYYWCKYSDMYCYAYAMSPAVDVNGTARLLVGKDKETLPPLTIETGIQDQTTQLAGITEFHDYLVTEGIEHEFITRDGSHDWTFWQVCLPKALNRCGEAFE